MEPTDVILGACTEGDVDAVREVLSEHPSAANARGFDLDTTPLVTAAHRGFDDVCELLLEAGAEVDGREGASDTTPLHWACEGGHAKVVGLLLDRGASLDVIDSWFGLTPLAWTAVPMMMPDVHHDRPGTAKYLIERGAPVDPFTAVVHDRLDALEGADLGRRLAFAGRGRTPLHIAARGQRLDALRRLLDLGADPDLPDAWGVSARTLALASGDDVLIAAFPDTPPDPSALLFTGHLPEGATTPDGPGLLHYFAELGHVAALRRLLAGGADVNAEIECLTGDTKTTTTPLHQAVTLNQADAIEVLLVAGADPNLAAAASGITPLHTAATRGSPTIITRLLEAGADPTATDEEHEATPSQWAALFGMEGAAMLIARAEDAAS